MNFGLLFSYRIFFPQFNLGETGLNGRKVLLMVRTRRISLLPFYHLPEKRMKMLGGSLYCAEVSLEVSVLQSRDGAEDITLTLKG